MGQIFITAVNAIFPIVLLILLGYFLRRMGIISESFAKTANSLVFKLFLPSMLFVNVYGIESVEDIPWGTVLYCAGAILALFAVSLVAAVLTTADGRKRGVISQCCFRGNFSIIGLPLSASLGGAPALAVSSVIATLVIPMFNILSVISLSVFNRDAEGKAPSVKKILKGIITNPQILGVVLGLVCILIRQLQKLVFGDVVFSLSRDLKFVYTTLTHLKSLATPLALVALGGQFKFSVVRGLFKEIVVGTAFRNVVAPVLGLGGALLLNKLWGVVPCGVETIPGMLCLFGTPVAVSSSVMAAEMGGDEQLAAQLVVWTSVASVLTMFLLVSGLMAAGLLAV